EEAAERSPLRIAYGLENLCSAQSTQRSQSLSVTLPDYGVLETTPALSGGLRWNFPLLNCTRYSVRIFLASFLPIHPELLFTSQPAHEYTVASPQTPPSPSRPST